MGFEIKKYPMYYAGVKQAYPYIRPGEPFLSKTVAAGNLIFLSGLDGRSLKTSHVMSTIEEQTVTCLENIRLALEEAGSSLENLAKNFILIKDYKDAPKVWKTIMEYFREYAPGLVAEPPAVTVAQVEALAKLDCLVEMDATAVVSKDAPGWEMKKYPMLINGIKQVPPNTKPGMPFLSESVVAGNLIFMSAIAGESPKTGKIESDVFEEQWRVALDKVSTVMDRAGSSLSNIIKTLHFQARLESLLTASKDLKQSYSPASDRLWKTELEYYDLYAPYLMDEPPASTFLKVSSLANPHSLGQTDITGVISRYRHGWEVRKYPTYLGQRGFPRHMGEIKKYYANTVKVGNLVFVSGQTPTDIFTAKIESNVFEEQLATTLDNLRRSLEETGSALENLVKTHILLPNPENLPVMRDLELKYYQRYAPLLVEEPPASTIIHPLNLASPSLQIEIEAMAFVAN